MTSSSSTTAYRERLTPGIGLLAAVLLIIPAVAIATLPFDSALAVPFGVACYLIILVVLLVSSPSIRVSDGRLTAGRAQIPVDQLGEIELLGAEALRAAIGPGLDARSYLLIRGWIHRGVRIENIDPADPAPYWIITSRRPQTLATAIEESRTG